MPHVPKLLGLSGLVPLWLGTLAVWLAPPQEGVALAVYAQSLFAALVCSFLGAVHWGAALVRGGPAGGFVWSVIPCLLAWIAILAGALLAPTAWLTPALLMGCLAAVHLADIRATRAGLFPDWYLRLRRWLTLGAQTALALPVAAIV